MDGTLGWESEWPSFDLLLVPAPSWASVGLVRKGQLAQMSWVPTQLAFLSDQALVLGVVSLCRLPLHLSGASSRFLASGLFCLLVCLFLSHL